MKGQRPAREIQFNIAGSRLVLKHNQVLRLFLLLLCLAFLLIWGTGLLLRFIRPDGTICLLSPPALRAEGSELKYQPAVLCGRTEEEIALLPNHSQRYGSNRYLVDGTHEWVAYLDAERLVKDSAQNLTCLVIAARKVVPCPLSDCYFQLFVRQNTSDIDVVRCLVEENALDYFGKQKPPLRVLDAGANVGVASVLFANMWPTARIISLEPASGNYQALVRNVAPFPNVTPLHAGLWAWNTELVIQPNDLREWGIKVVEKPQGNDSVGHINNNTILAVSIPYLLNLFNLPDFNIMKFVIEGSEEVVFMVDSRNDLTWLNKTSFLSVEFEDYRYPNVKAACKEALFSNPAFVNSVYSRYDLFKNTLL